jgi:glycosyltransferase involved in cell wall biosynthesis
MTDPALAAPLVSVLVLTFNRPVALARCLESLARQTQPRFEVVLVDVSTPPNQGVVEAYRERLVLRHLQRANRGVAVNRNVGAAAATAPLLAFLDDDCVARPDWLAHLLETSRRYPGALVGGAVESGQPRSLVAQAGQLIHDAVDRHFNSDPTNALFMPGLNFAVPAAGFQALDGNDGRFGRFGAEDRDFCRRWRAAGGRIVQAPLALVAHDHRTSLWGFLRQYYGYGRGAWVYHRQSASSSSSSSTSAINQDSVGSHLGLVGELLQGLGRQPWRQRLPLALLLLGWELANTAGVLHEALREAGSGWWTR